MSSLARRRRSGPRRRDHAIKDILDCVRHGGKPVKAPVEQRNGDNEINTVLAEIDRSASQALEGKSLQSLILVLEQPAEADDL